MTLCANLVVCMSLPPTTNGGVSYSDPTLGLNTVATYTCNNGYALTGGCTTGTCGSDEVWSGSAPTCQANCPDLPSLINGMIMYSAGSIDNRVDIDSVCSGQCTHDCGRS
ncbi:seizure protein 6 homolog [Halichondria panicea]|uniref:seizure protein 6 homolog n=1 Tax=Halichondria panicea TaxID=6063 RepID=UPI00312B5858